MPKGMSRTRGVKKKVNPLVEHIADFQILNTTATIALRLLMLMQHRNVMMNVRMRLIEHGCIRTLGMRRLLMKTK